MYQPNFSRYDSMPFARCGRSGIKLPIISLGLWHNFGDVNVYANGRDIALRALISPDRAHFSAPCGGLVIEGGNREEILELVANPRLHGAQKERIS